MTTTSAETAHHCAAGDKDERPKVTTLQTPVSASYPSELRSPLPGGGSFIKKEDGLKTPITPPSAYLDFLKSMTPALPSPLTGTSAKFAHDDKTSDKVSKEPAGKLPSSTTANLPVVQPSLSRTSSSDSTTSAPTDSSIDTVQTVSNDGQRSKPQSPRIVVPPSAFAKPLSAKFPRHVQIPQSPLSPASIRSPMSARSFHEPYSASALSANPWSATYSPTDADNSTRTSRVCVKQVVTRTVTYARTPLAPAPKGKRRKMDE